MFIQPRESMSDCILAASNLAPRVLDMPRDYAPVLGVSRTILNRSEQAKQAGITLGAVARKRAKPELKAFGARLAERRGKRSRQEVSLALKTKGVSLDESTLHGYENGRVWSVDVTVMLGLSAVLGVPFNELTALLVANRANPDATDWVDLLGQMVRHYTELATEPRTAAAVSSLAKAIESGRAFRSLKLAVGNFGNFEAPNGPDQPRNAKALKLAKGSKIRGK